MKIECYEGSSGQWSWLLKSGNGQVIARGDDSYTKREGVARAANNFNEKLATPAEVVFLPITPDPAPPEE